MHKSIAISLMLIAPLALVSLSGCGRPATAGPRAQGDVALKIREELKAGSPEAGGAGATETAAGGTGWGTLRGTFKYLDTPPKPGKLNVDKDTEVCGKGQGILDNSLLVSSDGGIANIVLYARAKRVHESAQPISKDEKVEPLVFDQKDCTFLSHVTACQVSRPVDIKNSDPVGHNTKIDPQTGAAFNQTVPVGQSLLYIPTREEAMPAPVSCSIHPWMKAYLLPRKDKYFAVTAADGSFEIANLPAGEEVEIQVWHERGTGPNGALVLPKKELKWTSRGRFKIKLEPDQTTDLALEVPAAAIR